MKMPHKIKICFFSPLARSLLKNEETETVGGSEIQQVMLAKVIKDEFEVSFIDEDKRYDVNLFEKVEGIEVNCIPQEKNMLFRFLSTLKALKGVDADVYIKRSAGGTVGVMALFCRLFNKKFIYCVAHDTDIDGTLIKKSYIRNPLKRFLFRQLFKLGLLKADGVIVQNNYQKQLLKKKYGKDSVIIKKGYPAFGSVGDKKEIVLWVSNIKEIKQPELFLKLAERLPEIRFQMIGGAAEDPKYYDRIKERAERIPNLEFLGYVPFNQVTLYFEKASLFVGTSKKEGDIPFTYYQALANKIPVVSLKVNPDNIIEERGFGFCSGDFEQLVRDVKKLMGDKKLREEMEEKGREYIKKTRSLEKMGEEFKQFLLSNLIQIR